MSPTVLLTLVAQYGPAIIPLVQYLVGLVENKQATLTADDFKQLAGYAANTSTSILAAEGVVLPAKA